MSQKLDQSLLITIDAKERTEVNIEKSEDEVKITLKKQPPQRRVTLTSHLRGRDFNDQLSALLRTARSAALGRQPADPQEIPEPRIVEIEDVEDEDGGEKEATGATEAAREEGLEDRAAPAAVRREAGHVRDRLGRGRHERATNSAGQGRRDAFRRPEEGRIWKNKKNKANTMNKTTPTPWNPWAMASQHQQNRPAAPPMWPSATQAWPVTPWAAPQPVMATPNWEMVVNAAMNSMVFLANQQQQQQRFS